MNKDNKYSGAHYIIHGFYLCFSKKYRKFLLFPVLANILILLLLWMTGVHFFSSFINWFDKIIPSWLYWLNYFFWISFFLSFLILGGYLFTLVAKILLSPFLSCLSEAVQRDYYNKPIPNLSLVQAPKLIIKSIFRQVRLLSYELPRLLFLLILFFVPVVNLIAGFLWFLFCSWMLAVQYLDYASEQNNQSLKDQLKLMRKSKFDMLIFGCIVMICNMIPVLNFFIVPAATIGGTRMFLDKFK